MLFKYAYVFVTGSRGRDKQSFAVARELAEYIEVVENWTESVSKKICETSGLIVSCGGGEATGAAYLTKQMGKDKIFAIQLMDPNEGHRNFDLIVSPIFEDKTVYRGLANVLNVLCMPSRNKQDVSGRNHIGWKNWALKNQDHMTMILVGGHSQFVTIKLEDFRETCEIICRRTLDSGNERKLIFVTSPRTPNEFLSVIKETTNGHGIKTLVSDWNKNKGEDDIVHGLLRHVKDVVVTGDSMSMMSEAVYYGSSVTIANNGGFSNERYVKLQELFFERGLAQPLTDSWKLNEIKGEIPNPLADIKAEVQKLLSRTHAPNL